MKHRAEDNLRRGSIRGQLDPESYPEGEGARESGATLELGENVIAQVIAQVCAGSCAGDSAKPDHAI
jgi:hypothetical protein